MENIDKSCCFTGYRLEKIGFDFNDSCPQYRQLLSRIATSTAEMIEKGCVRFYTGMAMGFDIIAAEHIALIKKLNHSIKLIAVIPFKDQAKNWPKEWTARYFALLDECDEIITLEDEYRIWAYEQRNRYMVDHSQYVLTYYDGKKGGTANTVKYAIKKNREILNIFFKDPLEEEKSRFKVQLSLIPPDESDS